MVAVADVAIALAERRPYRAPGDKETVLRELSEMSKNGQLETRIVEALADNFETIMTRAKCAQEADEARYVERYAMIG